MRAKRASCSRVVMRAGRRRYSRSVAVASLWRRLLVARGCSRRDQRQWRKRSADHRLRPTSDRPATGDQRREPQPERAQARPICPTYRAGSGGVCCNIQASLGPPAGAQLAIGPADWLSGPIKLVGPICSRRAVDKMQQHEEELEQDGQAIHQDHGIVSRALSPSQLADQNYSSAETIRATSCRLRRRRQRSRRLVG